jgi:hypothetical protein
MYARDALSSIHNSLLTGARFSLLGSAKYVSKMQGTLNGVHIHAKFEEHLSGDDCGSTFAYCLMVYTLHDASGHRLPA